MNTVKRRENKKIPVCRKKTEFAFTEISHQKRFGIFFCPEGECVKKSL